MNSSAFGFLHRLLICIGLLLTVSVLSAQTLTELVLVDANTNQDIRVLGNGGVVNIAVDGTMLNIRADVNGSVGSVKFSLTGQETSTRTESVAPYALNGDSSGNYNSWLPAVGGYTLLVELFAGSGASGDLLDSENVTFTVINQADTTPRALTVNRGSGSGNYAPGTVVPIAANTPPAGRIFDQWTGDTAGVASVLGAVTNFTMPASDAILTATYMDPPVAGEVVVGGELMQWHEVRLDLTGPASSETATPNPFLDYRFNVQFAGPAGRFFWFQATLRVMA